MLRTLLIFSSLCLIVTLQAQVLDASFATNGELLGNTPNNVDEVVDMALLDDGRILTAGRSGPNGASLITATRYLSDGQLDVDFGTGGSATLTISGNDYPQA
jgi:hypothetical protein